MKVQLVVAIVFFLAGCSNEQIYTAVQENQRQECGKLPQSQYEECMSQYETTYSDYERDIQAASNDESSQ